MNDLRPKLSVLAALQSQPDFSGLDSFPVFGGSAGRSCLQWMDRSGLALTFFRQLQNHAATGRVSHLWQAAFSQRLTANAARTHDMLAETRRINAAFASFGVTAVILKGITLSPDFCDDLTLRHQVDFDFLVDRSQVHRAADAVRSCGYLATRVNNWGETCFLTPLTHIPSRNDNLYALQRQRQVDLHTSLWEPCPWIPLDVPQDCLDFARPQTIGGTSYLGLSLEDKFLLQVLHAFRHSFRSWIRLSWLLEIAKCLDNHRYEDALWDRIIRRAGNTRLSKSIFSFVLGLITRLFATQIPKALRVWSADGRTRPLCAWLDHFALNWALSDWPGSLNNLFLAAEFISDPVLRTQYWRGRLVPGKTQTSLGLVTAHGTKNFLRLQVARATYVAHRAAVHLKDIAALPVQQFRWKRALESCRRPEFSDNC